MSKQTLKLILNSTLILLTFFILVYLALWQLARAQEKQNILSNIQAKATHPPIELINLSNPSLANDRFTKVTLHGEYLSEHSFLLDNQILQHKAGFRVLTPFKADGLNDWILIDRGWVARSKDQQTLPIPEPIIGPQEISGIINHVASGLVLKADQLQTNPNWPVLIQSLDYKFISQQLGHKVCGFVVQLPPHDLIFSVSVAKHFAYATQWFALALLLIGYCVYHYRRSKAPNYA